jgi:hypothetical protein
MRYSRYAEYLKHPIFLAVVETAKERSSGLCEKCGGKAKIEPHHIRYCKWGEFDTPENLLMLCRECHANEHRCQRCGRVTLKASHIKLNTKECCNAC